jgi:acyl dehydratase
MSITVIPGIGALRDYVGKPLGSSDWVEISQERIDAFAASTGDDQWIHCDVERARRESPFGGTVAHGYLTLSLAPMLIQQIVRVENVRLSVNYGLERMRLPAPVPAGSRVRMSSSLQSVRELRGSAARATYHLRFERDGSSKPVCLADAIMIYFP